MTVLAAVLWPLSLIFRMAVAVRRWLYRIGVLPSQRLPVPVVVVGNITAGGTGKTPLVLALAEALTARGWHPAIVSRGYGGNAQTARGAAFGGDPAAVGGESLLFAPTGVPVWL